MVEMVTHSHFRITMRAMAAAVLSMLRYGLFSRRAMRMFCPRICWVRGRFGAGLVLGDDGVDEFGIDENGDYYAYND